MIDGIEDERARWAEHEACFLPLPVALQGVQTIRDRLDFPADHPWRILDVGAGAGSIGVALRQVFPAAHLVAVEPRHEEREHLEPKYDAVFTGTIADFAEDHTGDPFDIVVGNTPWSFWGDCFDAAWPLVGRSGALVFHGPSTWGHSDETSEYPAVFDAWTPAEQWRVRGRVAYNGGSATDNRKVSWWAWVRGVRYPDKSWRCLTLPALETEQRRWRVRPGTEAP